MTYYDGNTTQSLALSPAVTSNAHNLVGSKPSLTVDTSTHTGLNLGATENKIGEVTIAADAAGQVKVNTLTFTVGTSGVTSASTTNPRIADGSTTISGSSCGATGSTITCTLGTTPNGYSIAAGQSKTFSLYAGNSGTATANVSVVSISTSLTSAGFAWDDVVGGGTSLTGANVYNFPTGSYSIRQ
jgi:hypothetical protein